MANESAHTKAAPKVMACNCSHDYQDQRYGSKMRLHNPRKDKKYACSVCGSIKG